jgi:hypothetical protein
MKVMNSPKFIGITSVSATPLETLGKIYEVNGKTYQYVLYSSGASATATSGTVVYVEDPDAYTVTNDISDGAVGGGANGVCGVMVSAATASYYAFMQVYGPHGDVATNGDDDIASGDCLIGEGTTDGTCNSEAEDTAPKRKILGWAVLADSDTANTVSSWITVGPLAPKAMNEIKAPSISVTGDNDASPKCGLGTLVNVGGNTYQYIRYAATADASAAAGSVLYVEDTDEYEVTITIAEGEIAGGANGVCGVALGTLTAGYYGWMLVHGEHATVKTSGADNIADGDALIGSGNGTCARVAAGTSPTNRVLGWATADDVDANNTVAAWITVGPIGGWFRMNAHSFGDVSACDHAVAQNSLGHIRHDPKTGKTYQYVKFHSGSDSIINGYVLYVQDIDDCVVTNDMSDGLIDGKANGVCGVAIGTQTAGYYGWMQIGGLHTAIANTGSDIASGDSLIGSADSVCASVAEDTAPTNKVLGWAPEAVTATYGLGYITVGPL